MYDILLRAHKLIYLEFNIFAPPVHNSVCKNKPFYVCYSIMPQPLTLYVKILHMNSRDARLEYRLRVGHPYSTFAA